MVRIGNNKINLHPCTEAEQEQNLQVINNTLTLIQEQITEGAVDNFTVKQNALDPTPAFFEDHFSNVGVTFDAGLHQPVYAETIDNSGALQTRLFTAIGGSGGDGRVKRDSGDISPQYLADCWATNNYAATNTFNTSTHFPITVSPFGTNDLQLYSTYSIIKTTADDGSPGMLYGKFADQGTYDSDTDRIVEFQNLGSALRAFVAVADLAPSGENFGTGYDETKIQLFGHVTGTFCYKTLEEWLKLLTGWSASHDQSILHDASGDPTWRQDGECD